MLAPEFGSLRPWEIRDLTPDEEHRIHALKRQLDPPQQEVSPWPPAA